MVRLAVAFAQDITKQANSGILKFVSPGVRFVRFRMAVWFSVQCRASLPVPFDLSLFLAVS